MQLHCVLFVVCFGQDYHLGDDTILDQISLAEPDQYQLPDLSAEEQAVILGVWYVFYPIAHKVLCLPCVKEHS